MISTKTQLIFSALIVLVNIIAVSHGCLVGWLSPFLFYLKSEKSHLTTGPLSEDDVSWIGSLLCLGAFSGRLENIESENKNNSSIYLKGTILFGWIAKVVGKRLTLLFLGIVGFKNFKQFKHRKYSLKILLGLGHFTFWIMVLTSTNVNQLHIARFFGGLSGGGILR